MSSVDVASAYARWLISNCLWVTEIPSSSRASVEVRTAKVSSSRARHLGQQRSGVWIAHRLPDQDVGRQYAASVVRAVPCVVRIHDRAIQIEAAVNAL